MNFLQPCMCRNHIALFIHILQSALKISQFDDIDSSVRVRASSNRERALQSYPRPQTCETVGIKRRDWQSVIPVGLEGEEKAKLHFQEAKHNNNSSKKQSTASPSSSPMVGQLYLHLHSVCLSHAHAHSHSHYPVILR